MRSFDDVVIRRKPRGNGREIRSDEPVVHAQRIRSGTFVSMAVYIFFFNEKFVGRKTIMISIRYHDQSYPTRHNLIISVVLKKI